MLVFYIISFVRNNMVFLYYIDNKPFALWGIHLDDVGLPGGDAGLIKLNKELALESSSLSNGRHVFEEPAPRSPTEHVQEGAVPCTASCSGPSSFVQDKREGIGLKLFILLSFPLIAPSIPHNLIFCFYNKFVPLCLLQNNCFVYLLLYNSFLYCMKLVLIVCYISNDLALGDAVILGTLYWTTDISQ